MRTWITRIYVAALCLAASVVSCTKDIGGNRTEDGKPMSFTAGKLRAAVSGSSVGGGWDGISSVAVKVGGEVREYNVTVSGGTAVLSCDRPFFWMSLEAAVEAWWPVDAADISRKPAVCVKADQSSEESLNASDFIEASGTVKFGTPKLEFRHRTAKVTVTLIPGEDISEEDIAGAELSLLTDAEGVEGGATSCRAFRTASGAFTALLPSQSIPAGEAFMTAKVGDLKYVFRPTAPVTLEAGKEYSYRLTVKKAGLEPIAAPDITDWGEDETGHGGGAVQVLDLSAATGEYIEVRDKKGLVIIGKTTGIVHIISSSVTLRDVEITGTIVTEGDVTLGFTGRNTVSVPKDKESWGYGECAAIYPKEGGTLTIKGEGDLRVYAGMAGAGIGGEHYADAGNIRIESGMITAYGGQNGGAGIGAGFHGNCGNIEINGGYVLSVSKIGAGIGGGFGAKCGNITINGGTVWSYKEGAQGAGIGAGAADGDKTSDCGDIIIGPGIERVCISVRTYYEDAIGSWDTSSAKSVTIDSSLKEDRYYSPLTGYFATDILPK